MNIANTTKEVSRIFNTAGLSKDVVDLLQTKISIFAEEISDLEFKLSAAELDKSKAKLEAEKFKFQIHQLEAENEKLKQKLENDDSTIGGLVESMGTLWRRTDSGFERYPYCRECESHPIMSSFADFFICSKCECLIPGDSKPPKA